MWVTKCELCLNKDVRYFTHEQRTDACICTKCGCVQRGRYTTDNCTFDNTESVPKTRSDVDATNRFHQLMARAFPREDVKRKREVRIKNICGSLDLPGVVVERAVKMLSEYSTELCKIRPLEHTLVACVIVATRSTAHIFLPMSSVRRQFHDIANISDLCKRVCKVVKINQRTIIINSIPYVVSRLRLPFRCEKAVRDSYDSLSRLAPSMCGETKLAVVVCKMLKENNRVVDIKVVAALTDSTAASIRGFMNKRRKK